MPEDPEDTVDLRPADLVETAVDATDEFDRPNPLEAETADVVEQKLPAGEDDEEYRDTGDER